MSEVWKNYLQQQGRNKKKVLSGNRRHLYLASKSHGIIHSELFTESYWEAEVICPPLMNPFR